MKTFSELRSAVFNNETLVWNGPEPLEGNNYIITEIEDTSKLDDDGYTPIYIKYNNGNSEAEVFLHEILIKKEKL